MIERGEPAPESNDNKKPTLMGSPVPDSILEGEDGEKYRKALNQLDELIDLYDKVMNEQTTENMTAFTDGIYAVLASDVKSAATVISAGISAMWLVKKMTGK